MRYEAMFDYLRAHPVIRTVVISAICVAIGFGAGFFYGSGVFSVGSLFSDGGAAKQVEDGLHSIQTRSDRIEKASDDGLRVLREIQKAGPSD